jgi:hypothetical protein
VLAALLTACAVFGVKWLARDTHPLLTAWRFPAVAAASLPTALASGASVLALDFGALGMWGALGGSQILFTACLGALWHDEALGSRRWVCMSISSAAIAALALVGG